MKFLLDTHAAFWFASGNKKFGKVAERRLRKSTEGDLAIADVTLFELALLADRKRIAFSRDFLSELATTYVVLPVTPEIATMAPLLALPQGDPFDRLIVATALHHDLILLTKDSHIADSKLVRTLW